MNVNLTHAETMEPVLMKLMATNAPVKLGSLAKAVRYVRLFCNSLVISVI